MRGFVPLVALSILVLGLPGTVSPTEKGGPEIQRERQTSTLSEISLKPLFLYSARGRRDPFSYDLSVADTSLKVSQDFSISVLSLVGFIGEWPNQTALFVNVWRQNTYKFHGGLLYSPEGVPVANVTGYYKGKGLVYLTQGESSILFRMLNNTRDSSLHATMDRDRKEPQR